MDIKRGKEIRRQFVSDGESGGRMICGRRNMNTEAAWSLKRYGADSTKDSERVTAHQTVTGVSRVEGSAVGRVGASSVEGFSFSSTPCPLHSGQEFRPLVSHYQITVSRIS